MKPKPPKDLKKAAVCAYVEKNADAGLAKHIAPFNAALILERWRDGA